MICRQRDDECQRLASLLADRRAATRAACADWHTWSLSACLAAGQSS